MGTDENRKFKAINSVTCIWVCSMKSHQQLTDYVNWKYNDQENLPKSSFSVDAGLGYFDSDFLECVFKTDKEELIQEIQTLSFVGNFKDQLMEEIARLDMIDITAVISLTGKKGPGCVVNEKLFDFKPLSNTVKPLRFVGAFFYYSQ
jgi:hypothetical protein